MLPSRLVVPVAFFQLLAQTAVIAIWRDQSPGPLLSDLSQLLLGIVVTIAAFQAARRSRAFGRIFWNLAGAAFSVWCLGQLLGTYYGSILNLPTQGLWHVDVLYTAWPAPLVMCLFLDPAREQEGLSREWVLDFAQVGIVFVLVYIYFSNFSSHSAQVSTWRLSMTTDGLMTGAFVLRALLARKHPSRQLFWGLAAYRSAAFFTDAYFVLGFPEQVNGAWFDLVWSVPWLLPLFTAVTWTEEKSVPGAALLVRPERRLVITQMLPLIFPLLVLVMAAEVARGQLIAAGVAVLLSLGISYGRLILTYRQQEQAAAALRQQHSLLEAISEGTTEAIFVKDIQGRYLMINSAGARLIGRSVKDVLGKDDTQLFSKDTAVPIMEKDRQVMEGGQTQTYQESATAGGITRTYLSTKGPYRDPHGRVIGLVGISVDITERSQAVEALAESEERFRAVFDGSPVGMAVIGMDGRVIASNSACRKTLGLADGEVLTTQLFDELTHPDYRQADAARYNQLASGEIDQFRQEKCYILRDRRTAWADLHLCLLRGKQGEPKYIIGMAVDTTEQKQLEVQLQQSQRMETIGRLAGGVAHDFNNLLTVIKGYCDLVLDRTKQDPLTRSQLQYIDKATGQAASLTRQLLAFSRQQVLQPKVFSLNTLVLNADKMLRRLIGENIEILTFAAPELGAVKADPSQIEQVILNLVVNARDAMPHGGKLTLETANVELDGSYVQSHFGAKVGKYVMVAVTDTGTGMDEQTLADIFEPFFTTKDFGKGTGLGLSMVYGIVKQSGGSIWVYSEKEQGTTFKVYLPRVDEPLEYVERSAFPIETAGGHETVLLVEDDPLVRGLTGEILRQRGYQVLDMSTPSTALDACHHHKGPIHLLLTDLVMPGMSGSEMASLIVKLRPNIRVLFMSGYTDNTVLQNESFKTGPSFLQKPFTPAALGQKVREILDE